MWSGQGDDAGNLVLCCCSETDKDDCMKKTSTFPHSVVGRHVVKDERGLQSLHQQQMLPVIENRFG